MSIGGKSVLAIIQLGVRNFLIIQEVNKSEGKIKVSEYNNGNLSRSKWLLIYSSSERLNYFTWQGNRYYLSECKFLSKKNAVRV